MTPITKAHSLTFSIATPIVFFIWKSISNLYGFFWLFDIMITAIISITFYSFIYKILLQACQKFHVLKKWLLGQRYFEGLWIGYYTSNGINTFYYEYFEQTLENLSIKGIAFDENYNQLESWTIVNPYINIEESKLAYYYELDELVSPYITLGYVKGTIHWDKHGRASKLTGYSLDSYSTKKEIFISQKVNIPNKPELQQKWIDTNFRGYVKNRAINSIENIPAGNR